MRDGIIGTDQINQRILRTARLAHFAWALISAGDYEEASAVLSEALLALEESGERFCESELHRLRGDLHMRLGADEEAEAEFCKAIEVAQAQKAKSWELRAATSLAQHYAENGQRSRAIEVLSPIYAELPTGADAIDVRAAKTVLDSLA
jgi:predicted ATPase